MKLYPNWQEDYARRGGTNWYRHGSNKGMILSTCQECHNECLVSATPKGAFCSGSCAKLANNSMSGLTGDCHPKWKGSTASYQAKHIRVYNLRGKATECLWGCSHQYYEWANITGNYDDPNDYAQMCKRCHDRFDAAIAMMQKDAPWNPEGANRIRYRGKYRPDQI